VVHTPEGPKKVVEKDKEEVVISNFKNPSKKESPLRAFLTYF
jgi:hypothetical protein